MCLLQPVMLSSTEIWAPVFPLTQTPANFVHVAELNGNRFSDNYI